MNGGTSERSFARDWEQHVIKKSYGMRKIIGFLAETRYML